MTVEELESRLELAESVLKKRYEACTSAEVAYKVAKLDQEEAYKAWHQAYLASHEAIQAPKQG